MIRPIFGSLGSNYSPQFIKTSTALLLKPWSWSTSSPIQKKITSRIAHQFGASPQYFFQGRQALTHILLSLKLPPQSQVLTQAFTCQAVETGITQAGLTPFYVDTSPNSLNLSLDTLKKTYKKASNPQVVIIQHTLGYPVDPNPIKLWCQKHKLYLIEDLAHAYAATDSAGKLLGSHSDAVMLSFGRDKILDAISGGASIIKSGNHNHTPSWSQPASSQVAKFLFYPLLTKSITSTYSFFVGKLIHKLANQTKLIHSPVTNISNSNSVSLPNPFYYLLQIALSNHKQNLSHRRHIAAIYKQNIDRSYQTLDLPKLEQSSCLRYPLLVQDRQKFLKFAKKHNLYLADVWYRAPVDSGRLQHSNKYISGSCPHAQALSTHIINLPTHQHINPTKAKQISTLVNKYFSKHEPN